MNILIVSFFDDNFGDMLIRISFERLLKTALRNLGVQGECVSHMHIKEIDEGKVTAADMIFFAGGAMFGMNYLNSFEYIDRITALADERDIPVVFSSIGINHKDATEENAAMLRSILSRRCVRAMSVRESASLFEPYAPHDRFEIREVCDPAVWCGLIYADEAASVRSRKPEPPVIGINVVRGGLFRANGYQWTLRQQEEYLYGIYEHLREQGVVCRFFTNGSVLDNNSLAHFAQEYDLPADAVIYPDNTREVVSAIAGVDTLIAIRMHAAIIAYALGVPSVNLVWNEKIPEFYGAIGYPDRAIPFDECTSALMADKASELSEEKGINPDPDYMMSVYRFLFDTLSSLCALSGTVYTFDEVARALRSMPTGEQEDIIDYRTKLTRTKKCYLTLFDADLEKRVQIKSKDKLIKKREDKIAQVEEKNAKLTEKLDKTKAKLDKTKEKLDKKSAALDKTKAKLEKKTADHRAAKEKLDWVNRRFVVRVYRKIRSIFGLKWYHDRKE